MSDDRLPFLSNRPVSEMSLVDIAEQLDKVTSWIEGQRVQEREARAQYTQVAQRVEAAIAQIRQYAQELIQAQNRKVSSFSGMLGRQPAPAGGSARGRGAARRDEDGARGGKMNISDAILAIWSLDRYQEQLTTEDIGEALPQTGYKSNAAPTSLKSSINQALAKLCRSGQVIRFRSDGSRISPRDNKSRARKYIAASLAGDE